MKNESTRASYLASSVMLSRGHVAFRILDRFSARQADTVVTIL